MPKSADTPVTAFKAFNPDLSCRGHAFEVGKAYEHGGKVEMCNAGFHACENPLDTLRYYPLVADNGSNTRFARVTLAGEIQRHTEDSKVAGGKITIDVELTLPEFIKAGIDWLLSNIKEGGSVSDKREAQLAASGYSSRLAASGNSSRLAASGNSSQLAASGNSSQLAASGNSSRLAASGYSSQLAASGNSSQLAASGDSSRLAASGYSSQLAASGNSSRLAASGNSSQLAASGNSSQLAASGDSSRLAASGNSSQLAASGDSSRLEITGAKSAAAAVGNGSRIKAAAGTPVAICEYNSNGAPIGFATGIAGKDCPADTWLIAKGGKLVEA